MEICKKKQSTNFWISDRYIRLSIIGISKLEVENSFINYFDKETEIYKGMKKIDDELGGTTPLNVIIKFPVKEKVEEEDDEFSEWEEESDNKEDKGKILVHER